MALKLTNYASSLLAAPINTGATTITIASGDEAAFPVLGVGDWHPLVVVDASNNVEIMRCTARAGVNLTVMRGQEGTAARAFDAGARVELRMTAAAIASLQDGLDSKLNVASVVIGNGADLNAYTTPGVYKQGSNAGASSGANYPVPYAGTLEVFDGGVGPMQRYTVATNRSFATQIFIRAYQTTWSDWLSPVYPARKITTGAGLTGGGDFSADRTLAVNFGTTANTVAAGNDSRITGALQSSDVATFGQFNTATAYKVLEADSVWADLAILADTATIAVDFNQGYDFGGADNAPRALSANRTLDAPSNVRNGKKGVLWFTATGVTRTLTLNPAWVLCEGVEAGPYSIAAASTLGIAYVCRGTTVYVTSILRIG